MPQTTNPFDRFDGAKPRGPVYLDPTQPYKAPQAEADLKFKGVSTENVRDEIRNRSASLDNTKDQQRVTNTNSLRDDYNQQPEVKAYLAALPQYAASLKTAPNGGGDISLIYDYAKVMDPLTGVREGEAASVATGQSMFDSIVAGLKQKLNGSGMFDPTYRNQLRREMQAKVEELNKGYLAQRVRYKETARRQGYDPRDVVGDHIGARYTPEIDKFWGTKTPQADWYGNEIGTGAQPPASFGPPPDGGAPARGPDPRLYGGAAEGYAVPVDSELTATSKSVPSEAKRKAYADLIGFLDTNPSDDAVRSFVGANPIYTPGFADELIKYHQGAGRWAASPGDLSDSIPLTANELQRNLDESQPDTVFMKNASNDLFAGLPRALATSNLLDPDGSRAAAINAADKTHPNYRTAGKFAGTVAGALLAEGVALKSLTAAGVAAAPRVAPILADLTYGGVSGATANPEHPYIGGLEGALSAGVGGGVGRSIPSAISPTGGKFADFYAAGGRPTLGQRFGDSGAFGRGLNTFEQATSSVPFTGSFTKGARAETLDQWKRMGFDNALGEIDTALPSSVTPGPDAFKFAGQQFDNAYDQALGGMRFVPDGQFSQDFGRFQRDTLGSGVLDGDTTNQLDKIIRNVVASRMRNGSIEGDAFKKVASSLRDIAKKTTKPELADAVRDYRNIFIEGSRRNSDPVAVALLDKADAGWAQYKPLKLAGRRAGSEPGDFTPTGLAAVERSDKGRTRAYIEGDTKLGDYVNLGKSLEDTLPNSGTADRWLPTALLGSGLVNPGIPAASLALPVLNAPIARLLSKGVLAPRGGVPDAIATTLRKRDPVLSALGVASGPALLQYYGLNP